VLRTYYPHHLQGFSYVGPHRYFLTFCCDNRRLTFGNADVVDLVMSQFLRASSEELMSIIACCFMPDHVHAVVEGSREDSDLKKFVARSKQLAGYHYKRVHRRTLWQRYSYERVLRAEESTRTVVAYVLENPVRAGLAKTVYEYPFLRSGVYSRDELIEYAYSRSG
jgi:REP element-mobilizing transposase RayT